MARSLANTAGNQDPAITNAGGPPPADAGGSSSGPAPIGVPKGFIAHALHPDIAFHGSGTVDVYGGDTPTATPARYFQGAQWLPASLGPDGIAQIQQMMVAGGLLAPGDAQTGVWDAKSVAAYTELLKEANASGLPVAEALTNRVQLARQNGVGKAAQGAKGPGGLTVQLTSDTDLENVFRNSFMQLTGNSPSQDDVNKMIQGYHNVETWTQTAQQQAQNTAATTGPDQTQTSTQAPTAANYAEQQIRQQHPLDVQKQELIGQGGAVDTFASALAQWGQK